MDISGRKVCACVAGVVLCFLLYIGVTNSGIYAANQPAPPATTSNSTVNADRTVAVDYIPAEPVTYGLTVTSTNPASGAAMTFSAADISGKTSGNTAVSLTYNSGTLVNITAAATAGGNNFSSWKGCGSVSGRTCTVTLNGDRLVTANYTSSTSVTHVLTVTSTNPASGAVMTFNPADKTGKTSGNTPVTLTYDSGTVVNVTAPATAGGNNFSNWSGCDSVNSRTCTATINADRTVTASYVVPLSISVNVKPGTTFQTWEAWRATATGPYFPYSDGSARTLSPSLLSQILDDLAFDLGLNGVRLEQSHYQQVEVVNDDSYPNHIVWSSFDFSRQYLVGSNPAALLDLHEKVAQVIQPLKQRVQSRGDPFYVYVSPIYDASNWPAHWNKPQEYAEFAQAFVQWMRGQNQPPSGLSLTPNSWVIVNEPNSGGFSMSTMALIIPAVAARFQSMGLNIKIETVETTGPTSSTDLSTVLNAPGVASTVGLISFHGYDYNTGQVPNFALRNNLRTVAAQLGKRTGMTEVCCKTGWDGSYTQALGWARDIYWNMTQANISVWEPLAMAYTCASVGCGSRTQNPISIDLNQTAYYKFANYYGLRQYSHYIRPNYVRVDATCTNCGSNSTVGELVKPVIFRSPGGKYRAVVLNDWSVAQTIHITGLPGGMYDITGVDPTHTRAPVSYPTQTISTGQALSLNFPAKAIVTFVER